MTTHTDEQLKRTLAEMLPNVVIYAGGYRPVTDFLCWKPTEGDLQDEDGSYLLRPVGDTELLHLCWLVEETLETEQCVQFWDALLDIVFANKASERISRWGVHSTWQQRTIALAKTKGIEIV